MSELTTMPAWTLAGWLTLAGLGLSACSSNGARPSAITPGAAKTYIQKNVTTQAEVIEVFGTPNIVTRRDDYEMWVWDKISSEKTKSSFGLGALGGGGGSGGVGVGGLSGGVSSSKRSETTVMLIMYFDENDVVTDYKITQTKF